MARTKDNEAVTLAAIVRMLEQLDGPARERVVAYIAQRYPASAQKAG
jgi:hypothetical protein